ncbi:MAG TPA: LacI family DNA-binding transcriptional regulator [Falsiroseomonas sp.]|jgi:DNA-binding LacI/PurR family transcriptional regulator|nr:LacI family DNA-binding transcriptional regulator [Falsiroseomonas sp.]
MSKRKRLAAVTSVDVAAAAGVSQSVVSRAFSRSPGVSAATRERILQVAARLGYRHNQLARGLITRRSTLLALVAGALNNPLHLELIQALSRLVQSRGHRVLLVSAPEGQAIDAAIAEVLPYLPTGIVAMAGTPSLGQVEECHQMGLPVVIVGRSAGTTSASSVSCDNEMEARRVAKALLGAGHRRFAFLSSLQAETSFSAERERGFCSTVVQAGCAAPAVVNGGSSYAGGYAAASTLFGTENAPEAVFCAGDSIALGLLDAARRDYGLLAPETLSVVGFDDVPMASWASYELTTVRQRVEEMATATIDLALRTTGDDAPLGEIRLVPGDLVVRRSARLVL